MAPSLPQSSSAQPRPPRLPPPPSLLFIGSSTEGLDVARSIRDTLEKESGIVVKLWNDGIIALSEYVADQMISTAAAYDFAVLVFTPDDVGISRDVRDFIPRDNVVFELGLFAGQLGRERTFAVVPDMSLKLPSDFAGVTRATYTREQDGTGQMQPSVHAACSGIAKSVKRLGKLRHPALEKTLFSIVTNHRLAFKITDPLFQDKLTQWCNWEKEVSEKWGRGLLRVRDDFPGVLLDVCLGAEKSIFSTSRTDSREMWNEPWGKRLLGLQEELASLKEPVLSERVFIYSQQHPPTPADIDIMKRHKDAKVHVYVYNAVSLPDVTDDDGAEKKEQEWTMIDNGKAIGVITSVDPGGFRAYWYFDSDKKAQYEEWKKQLTLCSEALDEWLAKQPLGD